METNAEDKACRKAEKEKLRNNGEEILTSKRSCRCGRYLNVPFVTLNNAMEKYNQWKERFSLASILLRSEVQFRQIGGQCSVREE